MPYREKTAWLMIFAITACFGPYFYIANGEGPSQGAAVVHQLWLFAITVVAQIVILAAGHAYLAVTSPEDARAKPDERDRAISARSLVLAYYVLISGMIVVGMVMPFNTGGWSIIDAALAMIVAAELVHYGAIAIGYRRQA